MKWVESLVYGDGELRNKRRTPRLSPEWPLHSSATDSLAPSWSPCRKQPRRMLCKSNHGCLAQWTYISRL
jgi:hypothetical protein